MSVYPLLLMKYVIVVSWFLQCMGYVPCEGCMYFRGRSIQHESGTVPSTVKTMRQLSCTDRQYKANRWISLECLYYSTYCALAVLRKIPYARRCSYSSIA